MIDPPVWLPNTSPKILKFIYSLYMVKDDWHPQVCLLNISPKILKFIYSLHMVKDDWPPNMTTQYLTKNFKVQI